MIKYQYQDYLQMVKTYRGWSPCNSTTLSGLFVRNLKLEIVWYADFSPLPSDSCQSTVPTVVNYRCDDMTTRPLYSPTVQGLCSSCRHIMLTNCLADNPSNFKTSTMEIPSLLLPSEQGRRLLNVILIIALSSGTEMSHRL